VRPGHENRVLRLLPNTCRAVFGTAFLLTGTVVSRADVGLPATGAETDPFRHVQALQNIATANRGNRAAGTAGYDRSTEYVADQLRAAGYTVRFEEFTFPFFEERNPPVLIAGAEGPDPVTPHREALRTLMNSGSGAVTAPVQSVDLGLENEPLQASTSGCEREDLAGFEQTALP
jgi:hypothetical protein